MPDKTIAQLPAVDSLAPNDLVVVAKAGTDDLSSATVAQVTALVPTIPVASQAEAEAGTNNVNRMTPLRTRQAIDYVYSTRLSAGAVLVDEYKLPSDPDDTLSFARALAVRPDIRGTAGKTYILNEFAPSSNTRIDLGGAIIQPAVGARFAIGSENPRNYVHVFNGFASDPDGNTLRTTTTTASASSGATVLSVASTANLAIGDAVWIITLATDAGLKRVLHYSRISALTDTTITLRDPIPAAGVPNGASVMHTKGIFYFDGWTRSRIDVDAFNCPLVFTLTGKNWSGVGSSHHRVTVQCADNIWLQVGVVSPDVAQCNYEIDTAFGATDKIYRPLTVLSFDSRGEVTGTSGDHIVHRCRGLNFTHALIGRRFILSFMESVIADNCYGFGFDFDAGSDVWATQMWAAYNLASVSVRGNSRVVVSQLQAGQTAPWAASDAIEVQDGSTLFLDASQVTGAPTVRNAAGWAATNVKYVIGPYRAENGTAAAPGYAFNSDPTTGLALNAPGILGLVAGGTLAALLVAAGFRMGWGSNTAPSYSFNDDSDTGLYRPNVDQLAIAAGGVRSFLCDVNSWWYHSNGVRHTTGTGSPEGVVTAPVGSIYLRSNGGAGTTFYVKESGTGNTGWAAK